jgi:hypothetical protein
MIINENNIENIPVEGYNTKNEVRLENGTIDCDFEHPKYGWIPFTADPNDVEEHGRAIYEHCDEKLKQLENQK